MYHRSHSCCCRRGHPGTSGCIGASFHQNIVELVVVRKAIGVGKVSASVRECVELLLHSSVELLQFGVVDLYEDFGGGLLYC